MKIKYFIFWLLVTVFSFINFSSADNFSQCKWDWNCLSCMCTQIFNECSNEEIECETNLQEDIDNCISECTDDDCSYCEQDFSMCSLGCNESFTDCNVDPDSYLNNENDYWQCYAEYLPWWDDLWWDNTWWELIWQLSPVITWLSSAVVEIIPYIVYIWLWVLGAILWFVAIKLLINWIRSKVLSPFK